MVDKVELLNEWGWQGEDGIRIECRDYRFGEWSFGAENPRFPGDDDTDLEYIDGTIRAWQAWREFVVNELKWE